MSGTWIFLPPSGGGSAYFGDPVAAVGNLPLTGTPGEVRYVIASNSFYEWTGAAWQAVGLGGTIDINTGTTGTLLVNRGGTGVTTSTGSGSVVLNTSPTLVTPLLGTPTSGVLTNCTGLPISSGVSGLAANVATFLGTPSSANLAAALTDETGTGAAVFANTPTLVTPLLGTPTSGVLTNCTGLPVASGISGLAANVATFLATPSSANLIAALTDETGTGANVFANTPTLVTPLLGTPTSGVLTNCTGLPVGSGISGLGTGVATFLATPSSANLAAALTDETGTGANVFATSPTLVTPLLGTPTSGVLTNCTGLPVSSGISGLGTNVATFLATPSSANLLAAITDETGTGAAVFANTPTLVTPVIGAATGTSVALSSGVVGRTTGSAYAAGFVGEIISTYNASAASISTDFANSGIALSAAAPNTRYILFRSTTTSDALFITLTAGLWLVEGGYNFTDSAAIPTIQLNQFGLYNATTASSYASVGSNRLSTRNVAANSINGTDFGGYLSATTNITGASIKWFLYTFTQGTASASWQIAEAWIRAIRIG